MPQRTLEQLIAQDPAGTALAVQRYVAATPEEATVADWRRRLAAPASDFERAFAGWFRREGFGDWLDQIEAAERTLYERAGGLADFEDWARQTVARLGQEVAALVAEPATRQVLATADSAAAAQIIADLYAERHGFEQAELVRLILAFADGLRTALATAVGQALSAAPSGLETPPSLSSLG